MESDVAAVQALALQPLPPSPALPLSHAAPTATPTAATEHADLPVLLVDITSLSRGAVSADVGAGGEGVDERLVERLLRHLADARDFDSHCDAFLFQHAFCRLSSPANMSRDLRAYCQSLPQSHVVRTLAFPPSINGVSSALMFSRICSPSPHSCVQLIKQLLRQCLRPLHWKYAYCLELEHMAAACAAAAPRPPPRRNSLPDFQLSPPPPCAAACRASHFTHVPDTHTRCVAQAAGVGCTAGHGPQPPAQRHAGA
jgi:hypothetical protein